MFYKVMEYVLCYSTAFFLGVLCGVGMTVWLYMRSGLKERK